MTEQTPTDPQPGPATPPRPIEERPRATTRARQTAQNAVLAGVSLVWLVPILALAITLGLAWNNWAQRGDLIQVSFADATGITPGETVLKFREVAIGRVESVRFSSDLSRVVLDVRVDQDVAKYIDDKAQFWIVRPQVSTAGISRLDTVLTGVFIEGDWDSNVTEPQKGPFVGLDRAPLTRANQSGSWVVISSDSAKGLSEGAPVLYRGIVVGRMENIRLSPADEGVMADLFINAPHDKRLTTTTAFWNTSGLSVSLGAQGLALNIGSLASVVQGGIQFETLTSGGEPVRPGHVFHLNANEAAARDNVLAGGSGGTEQRLTVLLDNNVRGLAAGADVQYRGLSVGRVTDLKLRVEPGANGAPQTVQQEVTIAVQPGRLGLPPETAPQQTLDFLREKVGTGMRARVASAGFLGTSLMIELAEVPNAAPASLDLEAKPYPVMPSAPGDISDFTATAQGFISKVGQLPLEETLRSAQDMMNSITALASSEDIRAVPGDARRVLGEAEKAAGEIRTVASDLRASGAAEKLGGAVDATQRAADALADATKGMPKVVDRIGEIADNAARVDLKGLGDAATDAAAGLRDIVTSKAARDLPEQLGTAVTDVGKTAGELQQVATELRRSGAAEKLATMIDEASAAAEAVRLAAADVPDMVDKIDTAAASVEAFDFAGVSAEAKGLVADLRAMLGTEDAAALPKNLSDTLQSASGLLNDLRDGNAAGSLNAALGSAKTAADRIAVVTERLPQVAQRYEQLAARAEAVIAAYGDRSTFNTEAITMMRELRRATAAFGQLAQTIERNPRAFILGR